MRELKSLSLSKSPLSQPITYEVQLTVESHLANDYLKWLKSHITQMLQVPGFIRCDWFQLLELETEEKIGTHVWILQYKVETRERLQKYFQDQAPVMRADGLKKFPQGVTIQRKIYSPFFS